MPTIQERFKTLVYGRYGRRNRVGAILNLTDEDVQALLADPNAEVSSPSVGSSGLPDGGDVGEVVVNTAPGEGEWGVPASLIDHVAEQIGDAHPLIVPTAPPQIEGVAAVAAPGEGTLPAAEYWYWVSAIFADGSLTDWNQGAGVSLTTGSMGGVMLSCDPMPDAVGYRWYGGLDGGGERYWDTEEPTYLDADGTGGGDTYPESPQTVYTKPPAMPWARIDNYGTSFPPADMVLAAGAESAVAFDQIYTFDPDRFELVLAPTPHLHIKLPGVYLITLQATAPNATPWDLVTGRLAAVDFNTVAMFSSYHSGKRAAVAGESDGSGKPQLTVEKTFVTNGGDNSQWTVFARIGNSNGDGPRSIGGVEMRVITLVR